MDTMWIAGATGAALIIALLLLKKLPFVEQWLARERFARFHRLVLSIEQTNEAYFHSLEAMLKTLESLRAQTDEMEHRLRSIVAEPIEKRRQRGGDIDRAVDSAALAAMLDASVRRKVQRNPKSESDTDSPTTVQNTTSRSRLTPAAVIRTQAPQAAKSARGLVRPEVVADHRANGQSLDNKKTRLNGVAE